MSNLLVSFRIGSVMERVAASTLPNHFISRCRSSSFAFMNM